MRVYVKNNNNEYLSIRTCIDNNISFDAAYLNGNIAEFHTLGAARKATEKIKKITNIFYKPTKKI